MDMKVSLELGDIHRGSVPCVDQKTGCTAAPTVQEAAALAGSVVTRSPQRVTPG
jgi:hypothetical protein